MRTLALILALASVSHAKPPEEKPLAKFEGGTAFMAETNKTQWLIHCIHGMPNVKRVQMTPEMTAERVAKRQMDPGLPAWSRSGPKKRVL